MPPAKTMFSTVVFQPSYAALMPVEFGEAMAAFDPNAPGKRYPHWRWVCDLSRDQRQHACRRRRLLTKPHSGVTMREEIDGCPAGAPSSWNPNCVELGGRPRVSSRVFEQKTTVALTLTTAMIAPHCRYKCTSRTGLLCRMFQDTS